MKALGNPVSLLEQRVERTIVSLPVLDASRVTYVACVAGSVAVLSGCRVAVV